MIYNNWFW